MKRAFLFAVLAFIAGPSIGYPAPGGDAGVGGPSLVRATESKPEPRTVQQTDTRAADLAGIEKLHREDIAVTLSQDPKGLMDVWTEDGVRLLPGGPAEVGKKAIQAGNAKGRAQHPEFQVLTYVPEFKELQVVDGWAFEWGYTEATYKLSHEGPVLGLHGTFLRVLRRQSDGSWKFARVIGNWGQKD